MIRAVIAQSTHRKTIWRLFALFILVWITLLPVVESVEAAEPPPLAGAYDLIDLVNQLRATNGLAPYQVNSILMSTAQGHSDYQAAIGEITHTGSGGSRPIDRARAAGYGGGAQIFISENIAGGTSLSSEKVVEMWQGDAPHLNTMLGANYTDVGAGVAKAGDFVYYTLDVGYSVGGSGDAPPPTVAPGTPGTTYISPVTTTTPRPDGSLVHIVQYGQALITIAKAYGVTVAFIKEQNGLTSDAIYVGDRLIIRLAYTPTPTGQDSPVPSRTPRPTKTYTTTLTPRAKTSTPDKPQFTQTSTPVPATGILSGITKDPILIAILLLAVSGGILMLAGVVLKRRG